MWLRPGEAAILLDVPEEERGLPAEEENERFRFGVAMPHVLQRLGSDKAADMRTAGTRPIFRSVTLGHESRNTIENAIPPWSPWYAERRFSFGAWRTYLTAERWLMPIVTQGWRRRLRQYFEPWLDAVDPHTMRALDRACGSAAVTAAYEAATGRLL